MTDFCSRDIPTLNVDLIISSSVFVLQLSGLSRSGGDAVLKFEPFVLHVQCRRLEDAQLMVR